MSKNNDGLEVGINIHDSNAVNEQARKLIQQQKKLYQYDKEITLDQFARFLVHDLNNVIGPIMGYAELIEMKVANLPDGEKLKEYAHKIIRSSQQAKDFAKKISAMREMDEPELQLVNLAGLLQEILALISVDLPSAIELELDIADKDIEVKTSPIRIQQAILALCENACDAMGNEGRIVLSLERADFSELNCIACGDVIDGECIVIAVRDQGPGINPDQESEIFRPFYTTKSSGSAGLGLAVVSTVVHGCGGHLLLGREAGPGACVKIILPQEN